MMDFTQQDHTRASSIPIDMTLWSSLPFNVNMLLASAWIVRGFWSEEPFMLAVCKCPEK